MKRYVLVLYVTFALIIFPSCSLFSPPVLGDTPPTGVLSNSEKGDKDLEAILPEDLYGFYLVVDGTPIAIPGADASELFWDPRVEFNDLAQTDNKTPIVLLRSTEISPSILLFNNMMAKPGIEASIKPSGIVITSVTDNTSAAYAGIKIGDTVEPFPSRFSDEYRLFWGQYGTELSLTLLQGTQQRSVVISRDMGAWKMPTEYSYNIMDGGYVQLVPSEPLESGMYCYGMGSVKQIDKNPFWCFYVKP